MKMKTNGGSRACQCVLWPHHDVVIRRRKQPPVRRHPKELQRHLSIYQTSGRKYVQQSQLSCQLKIGLERTAIVRIDMTTSVHWIGHNPNLEAQGSEVLVPRDEG